jgi:hypothetical protein
VPQAVRELGVDHQCRTVWGPGGRHGSSRHATAVVDEEDRLQIGTDGLVEGQAVADGAGDGVLVRQDDAVLGRRQAERADQTPLHVPVRCCLLVDVQRGDVVGAQDPLVPPVVQRARGTPVPVLGPVRRVAWEDEAHDVVLARCLERGHAVLVDDVVGRGGQRVQVAGSRGVVTQRTERRQDQAAGAGDGGGRRARRPLVRRVESLEREPAVMR